MTKPNPILDRTSLAREGYLIIPGLLDQDWIQQLKAEQSRFSAKSKYALTVQAQLVHRSRIIREFVTNGPQVDIAVEVLGKNVCFTHQQYVTKYPDEKHRSDVLWHQDNGFGRLEPPEDLTVWMTLDDCDEANGCLWVIPGSHQRGLLSHESENGLMTTRVNEPGIPLPMRAGDAVIFGSLLLHSSKPNRTDKQRVAMYVRYCTPNVVMANEGNKPVLEDAYSWLVAGEAS